MWQFTDAKESVSDQFQEDKEKLFAEIEEKKKEIIDIVDSYHDTDTSSDVKDMITNGFQIYVNGRVVNMEVTDVKELPADRLKADIKTEFQAKLGQIKESINEKLYSLSESYESLREKLDDEIEKAKVDSQKVVMPDITYDHARKGLSVVKGQGSDELVWLCRGYYIVRTVDGYPISKELSESTMQQVMVQIETRGNKVTNVKVKKLNNLAGFNHYHATDGGSTDCWGDWSYHIEWEVPDDILKLGKQALKILEDINTDSPGNSDPAGFPSLDKLISSKNDLMNRNRRNELDINETSDSIGDSDSSDSSGRNYIWTLS